MSLNEKHNTVLDELHQNSCLKNHDNYLIAICQGGKFVATFDIVNLRIRILENIDHRPFAKKGAAEHNSDKVKEISETITHFKINENLDYEADCNRYLDTNIITEDYADRISNLSNVMTTEVKDRWSLSISNLQRCGNSGHDYHIYVAVSHIDINECMNGTNNYDIKNKRKLEKKLFIKKKSQDVIVDVSSAERKEIRKGTVIYCFKLRKTFLNYVLDDVNYYYYSGISGICKFIENLNSLDSNEFTLRRFILLNYNGMYSFKIKIGKEFSLKRRYEYPKCVRSELDYWYKERDCMNRLLSCIYDKYLIVVQYKNSVQLLEVYNLAKMELDTTAKRIKKNDNHTRNHVFSISRLQLCFTQGLNSIGLYIMENGLEIASKDFHEMEEIYSLEFIDSDMKLLIIGKGSESQDEQSKILIWDLYKTGQVKSIKLDGFPSVEDLGTRLVRTSGNLLYINNKGKVISVIQQIENELEIQQLDNNLDESTNTQELDRNNFIHVDKDVDPNLKSIIIETEPWVIDKYKKHSYCLYLDEKEILQLIISGSTVQIWHQIHSDDNEMKEDLPNKGEPFLEYIWSNGIPVDQENEDTRLQIREFVYDPKVGSRDKLSNFRLKVYWSECDLETNKIVVKEKMIQSEDIYAKCRAVRHACKSLEHLNRRKKFLSNNYIKTYEYEKMFTHTKNIVWRFAKNKPDQYLLLDIRHNLMKNLIIADCDYLVKTILFGDRLEENENFQIRHIPRSKLWPGKKFIKDNELDRNGNRLEDEEGVKPRTDMELAIYHCRERELKDTIIIAYLLEYYSSRAKDYAGWMNTVSKALPLLFKYNYDDYARKLFRKECFADQDHFSAQDPLDIIPKQFSARRNHDIKFRAFRPLTKLQSDSFDRHKFGIRNLWSALTSLPFKMSQYSEDFDNSLGKSPLSLRVVPLPKFTMNRVKKEKVDYSYVRSFLNILWFIFIPQWYKIGDRNNLSPFSNVIRYENNDDIYDNPATEAIIDYYWHNTRNYFSFIFLRFLIFFFCFHQICWSYINHRFDSAYPRNVLMTYIIIFYYLAIYLSVVEITNLYYRGPRKYFGEIFTRFDFSNYINIVNIVLPVITVSTIMKNFQFIDGFGSQVESDDDLIIMISFCVFFLWMGAVFHLRLISYFAVYIYYIMIIFQNVLPFILFMLIIIVAFGHTMFVMFKANITTKDTTFSGYATDPLGDSNYTVDLIQDFNTTDSNDNPFASLYTSILAAYFWLGSDWVQRENFDYWANDVFTLIASIYLVIVLQNMLIAFMTGVYDNAETKGRQALLRFRANHIAEYEALHHVYFWKRESDPKYIYYIGQSQNFEEWYMLRKNDRGEIYKDFEEKYTFTSHIFVESTFKSSFYERASVWKYDLEERNPDDVQNE